MAVGAAGCALVAFVVGVMGVGTGTTPSAAATSLDTLNVAAIPAAMQSVAPYVALGGMQCSAVSPPQIAAQIDTESAWDPNAVSSAGAEGLAQFLPTTWPSYAKTEDGTGDVTPFNPNDAAVAMGRYDCANAVAVAPLVTEGDGSQLSLMLASYDGPAAVLAAHGVPADVATYVKTMESRIAQYTATSTTVSGFGAAVVGAAERELGVPYVWGGGDWTGPTDGGFDCSGLVLYAVAQASHGAIKLPHSSETQVTMGTAVTPADMGPGDVIGFDLHTNGTFDHVGIYVGDGEIIDAPYTTQVVRFDPLSAFEGHPWAVRSFG